MAPHPSAAVVRRVRSWRAWFLALSLLVLSTSAGCGKVDSALTYVGLRSAAPPAAVEVDVVCDAGGAPCTTERLRVVAAAAFGQVASRPGSVVRLWWLGNSVGETTLLASVTVPPGRGSSARALAVHRSQVVRTGVSSFAGAAAPYFRAFVRRRSPILESLGKISLASTSRARVVWLVSDLLEERVYRFECGALPDETSFRETTAMFLPPDSLRGVAVAAVYAAPNVIDGDRCPVSVARFRAIAALYETAIAQAGGRFQLSPTSIPTIGGIS